MKQKLKVFTVFFLIMAVLGFGEAIGKINSLNVEIETLKLEEVAIASKTEAVAKKIVLLEESSYVEILARENLNMIYPGEQRYLEADLVSNVMEKTVNDQEVGD